jgi:hypothetical protein
MDFFDAHFHIWDLSEDTLSGHDASILFAPGGDPVYTVERYENEFTALPKELVHTGGVRLVPCSVQDEFTASFVWLVHAHAMHTHTLHFGCSRVPAWQGMACILLAAHTTVAHALCTCAHWETRLGQVSVCRRVGVCASPCLPRPQHTCRCLWRH